MKPRPVSHDPQGDLFKTELNRIIDMNHPLIRSGANVDWERFDEAFGKTYHENNGRPGSNTRLLVALHYLKNTPSTSAMRM